MLRFLFIFCTAPIFATTYHVSKTSNYNSIQQTINLSKNGDTILVEAGLYKEKNIVVNKEIILKGIQHPTLDGE